MTTYYFVRPTDSLFVRGNLAFGQGGEHGCGVMPPPPSLFAGAFRSAMLGRNPKALAQFTQHGRCDDAALNAALGSVEAPGAFRISRLTLAGIAAGKATPEAVVPLPADLLRLESGFAPLTPGKSSPLAQSGGQLSMTAVLRSAKQEKPQGGFYLRQSGFARHLAGTLPTDAESVKTGQVHTRDPRLGIGLNTDSRTAETGLIYTTEGHAFSPRLGPGEAPGPFSETGFLVGIEGADDLLPEEGFLRLGGDGRGAQYRRVDFAPSAAPLDVIQQTGRFRLILNTPGLFADGWLPPGLTRIGESDYRLQGPGFSARLACAAFGRREVISGWDLFNWKPKAAQRAVPAGSVYWFDGFEGDPGKLAEWVNGRLWPDTGADAQRRAEGYNLAWLAAWKD